MAPRSLRRWRLGFAWALALLLINDAIVLTQHLEGARMSATESSPFIQRVRALPIGDRLDNLVLASEVLRYVRLKDAAGSYVHEQTARDIDRHLERRWLGAIGGLAPPAAATVGEAIDYERAGAGTGLRELGQIAYTAAIRPQLPDASVEELRKSAQRCERTESQRNRTVPYGSQAELRDLVERSDRLREDCRRPELDGFILALSNETKRPIDLPRGLLLTVRTGADAKVVFECGNDTEGSFFGRPFRPLSPNERALVRCKHASPAVEPANTWFDATVRALNTADGWQLRPADHAYEFGGDLLGIHDNLPALREAGDVSPLLSSSSCRERSSCFAEGLFRYAEFYARLFLLVVFVHGALPTALVAVTRPRWLLNFAYVASGAIVAVAIALFPITASSLPGIVAEQFIWFYQLHTVAALAGVWLTYLVARWWLRRAGVAVVATTANEEERP